MTWEQVMKSSRHLSYDRYESPEKIIAAKDNRSKETHCGYCGTYMEGIEKYNSKLVPNPICGDCVKVEMRNRDKYLQPHQSHWMRRNRL